MEELGLVLKQVFEAILSFPRNMAIVASMVPIRTKQRQGRRRTEREGEKRLGIFKEVNRK